MRILFCNYEYPPLGGGGGVVNALLAEELATRHEVTVVTSCGLGLPERETVGGVRLVRAPVFFRRQKAAANIPSLLAYLPMGVAAGKRLLETETFDVINTHFVIPTGPVGDTLSRFSGIPNVLSVHGGDLYDPSKWMSPHRHAPLRAWVRRLARRADRVVGQSSNTIANVHEYYDPQIACDLIPLGIRRPPRESGRRSDYGLTDDDVLLVTVGRLVGRKAVDRLIEMMTRPQLQGATLLVMGSGPALETLKAQSAAAGLGERVRFLGHVDEAEKFRVLNMSDAFVSTSQHEGFGLVFLEAMACGLPVVCYDHGGQTDFLTDGETGFMPPLNDLDKFTESCGRLVSEAGLKARLAEQALARVETLFIDRCASLYEALFLEVIEKRRELEPR